MTSSGDFKINYYFCGFEKDKMQHTYKERRKELLAWAKENLIEKEVFHTEFCNHIIFSVKGIKEYINQPHEFYYEKNEMLKNIESVIKGSEYKGYGFFKARIFHIFEIEINGKNSWLIAHEHQGRKISLYSISDNPKVLTDIKK